MRLIKTGFQYKQGLINIHKIDISEPSTAKCDLVTENNYFSMYNKNIK